MSFVKEALTKVAVAAAAASSEVVANQDVHRASFLMNLLIYLFIFVGMGPRFLAELLK